MVVGGQREPKAAGPMASSARKQGRLEARAEPAFSFSLFILSVVPDYGVGISLPSSDKAL